MFESILGNEPIKAYLRKAVHGGILPHALLFAGTDGVGKSLFAKRLAAHLLGDSARVQTENHPDFHVLRPDRKSALHSIESLRRLIDEVHAAPFEAQAKVFLIHDAHRMQPAAASALLKTLEEPTPGTVLILLTGALQEILPTIASRCCTLRFHPLSEGEIASLLREKGMLESLAKRAGGSAGAAFGFAARSSLEESLFALLSERRNYPQLALALEKIEKEVEDEDPMRQAQAVEHLFSVILMWHRDQAARLFGVSLFFPEAPRAKGPLPDFVRVEKAVDEAYLAFSRNIRLAICLEKVFSAFSLSEGAS